MKRFAKRLLVWTTLATTGFPTAGRAAEPAFKAVPVVVDEAKEKARMAARARREALATRIVEPEALKVLSRHFNVMDDVLRYGTTFEATVLREYAETASDGAARKHQAAPAEWSRADIRISTEGAKVTRYWPGGSDTFTANEKGLFITDSRFPKQYVVEPFGEEEWARSTWPDRLLKRTGLDWGALTFLSSHRAEFATILLHPGLISVTPAAPRELDGEPCDVVEIRVADEESQSLYRLAVARSDNLIRLLEADKTMPEKGTSVTRERYLHVRQIFLAEPDWTAAPVPAFPFIAAPGARQVRNFPRGK